MANKITHVLATLITASGILVSANAMACSEHDYLGSVCLELPVIVLKDLHQQMVQRHQIKC